MAISKKIRKEVYRKYDGHCAYCGREIAYKDMQVDHFLPLRAWELKMRGQMIFRISCRPVECAIITSEPIRWKHSGATSRKFRESCAKITSIRLA